jgi:hypothetical protein
MSTNLNVNQPFWVLSGNEITITAKNAENAKITVTTNSKRTHNKLFQPEFVSSSYQFVVKMKLCELSASAVRVLCKFRAEI